MSTVRFTAEVLPDGTIRPPAGIHLAPGKAEITVDTVEQDATDKQRSSWPAGYFDTTAGALAGEDFERPAQGELPRRDVW
jgi:hypothetical protein